MEQLVTARQDMNFARFQHKLKTFLFGRYPTTAHRDCLLFCAIEIPLLTYLHFMKCFPRRDSHNYSARR